MANARVSLVVLVVLGLLFVVSALGIRLFEWEWWPFLLILSGLAFVVAAVLTFVRRAFAR